MDGKGESGEGGEAKGERRERPGTCRQAQGNNKAASSAGTPFPEDLPSQQKEGGLFKLTRQLRASGMPPP